MYDADEIDIPVDVVLDQVPPSAYEAGRAAEVVEVGDVDLVGATAARVGPDPRLQALEALLRQVRERRRPVH
jgi:hypothetical protein